MSKQENVASKLAQKMMLALVLGLICGVGLIFLRENLNANGSEALWNQINSLLFADISASGNEKCIGLFYVIGQLFVRALQVIIVPMVFTSITLAMIRISDSKKLGRISSKTLLNFLLTTSISLLIAGFVGMGAYKLGFFETSLEGLAGSTGSTGSNPLMILINAVPNNVASAFSNNGGVLAIVVLAVAVGLAINACKEKIEVLPKLCEEISQLITICLTFIVNKFGPIAIFVLITRTFAVYGINYLKPAFAYVIVTVILLFLMLLIGYGLFVWIRTGLKPANFVKKISKVALFGFSTSSSAATLPLNLKTTTEELGVHEEIASFVLPLGMTINMDGTAIMQVIAAIFIASCGGYEVTLQSIFLIAILALVASIGTPAAPGAGAVVLFTILSGMGYSNDLALMAYTLILAINRPIEMLVTSLNVVGDSAVSIVVAKSENALDEDVYNR
ncbi:MAG: dicarboxylate/amino acid:cation symporter [Traorella sp.]